LSIIEATSSFLATSEGITVIVGITGIAITGIISYFEKKRFETTQSFEEKKYRTTILMRVIQQLNNIKHREARKVLYEEFPKSSSYEILGISENISIDELKKIASDLVRGDLNEIGTLSHHGLIDDYIFIEEFYWVILRIWNIVEPSILDRRKKGPSDYMKNFEELKEKAKLYVKKHGLKEPSPYKITGSPIRMD